MALRCSLLMHPFCIDDHVLVREWRRKVGKGNQVDHVKTCIVPLCISLTGTNNSERRARRAWRSRRCCVADCTTLLPINWFPGCFDGAPWLIRSTQQRFWCAGRIKPRRSSARVLEGRRRTRPSLDSQGLAAPSTQRSCRVGRCAGSCTSTAASECGVDQERGSEW